MKLSRKDYHKHQWTALIVVGLLWYFTNRIPVAMAFVLYFLYLDALNYAKTSVEPRNEDE